jgi:outer membrane protein assembly factor BamB
MAESHAVIVGLRGTVVALDVATGAELWRTALKGSDFVNVTLLNGIAYAATKGELFALDSATGTRLWHNTLKGLGLGLMTIAGAAQVPSSVALRRKQQEAAAAAAIVASS